MPTSLALTDILTVLFAAAGGAALGLWIAPVVRLFRPYEDFDSPPPAEEPSETPDSEEEEPEGPLPPMCPHCGDPVPWPWWTPLPLWLLWERRCPHCARRIRGPVIVPVLLALACAALAVHFGPGLELLAFAYFAAIAIVLAVVDMRTHRLPDPLVKASYPVSGVLLMLAALDTGAAPLLGAAIGMVGLVALYGLLVLITPMGMGRGDFKISGLLGLYLGWTGLVNVVVALYCWTVLSAVYGVVRAALRWATNDRRAPAGQAFQAARKMPIPLGPFMLVGSLGTILAGDYPARLVAMLVG